MAIDIMDLAVEKLGKWPARGAKKELAHLPTALLDGETVRNLAAGDYKDRMGKGLLVLTDRRLLFIEASGMFGTKMNMEDFPIDRISSVSHQLGAGSGTIEVFASGNKAKITTVIPRERVEEIAGEIRNRLNSPAASPAPIPDPAAQLTQLKSLLDAGVLNQQEFDAKKGEILARM